MVQSWVSMVVITFLIAVLIFSILMDRVSNFTKIILVGGLFFCVVFILKLNSISRNQIEISSTLEKIFTTLEMNRLEPNNHMPAANIIAERKEHEIQMREIYGSPDGFLPKVILFFGLTVYIGGTIHFAYLLATNWDHIISMDFFNVLIAFFN